jgi:hypothetical protein
MIIYKKSDGIGRRALRAGWIGISVFELLAKKSFSHLLMNRLWINVLEMLRMEPLCEIELSNN